LRTPLQKCSLTADDGAWPPLEWYPFRQNGAWRPRAWCSGPPCVKLFRNALALAHGFALDLDGVGVVDDPVTDGVGQGRIVQVLVPLTGVILGTEDGRGHLV